MNPRKSPLRTEFSQAALDDMTAHTRNHGANLAAAVGVWRGNLKSSGLPKDWGHEQLLQLAPLDGRTVHWRIYVREVRDVYMGFAETLGGEVLVLLSLLPAAVMLRNDAIAETVSRVPWNSRYA